MTDLIEYAPACGDEDNSEAWHQESLNELEQLTFETESNLNDLWRADPIAATKVVNVFISNLALEKLEATTH